MIRFFLRLLGLLCLAAAFLLIIYDGTKSIVTVRLAPQTYLDGPNQFPQFEPTEIH